MSPALCRVVMKNRSGGAGRGVAGQGEWAGVGVHAFLLDRAVIVSVVVALVKLCRAHEGVQHVPSSFVCRSAASISRTDSDITGYISTVVITNPLITTAFRRTERKIRNPRFFLSLDNKMIKKNASTRRFQ